MARGAGVMRVLSLFDGISCGQVALHRAGFIPNIYFASEIDKSAIKITQNNWPNTVQCGDVRNVLKMVKAGAFGQIDLILAGSPCQGFSRAGLGKGFSDDRSSLIFECISIIKHFPDAKFILENVKMKNHEIALISALTGVTPVEIDSKYFSAQNRKRLYWSNIPLLPFVDCGVTISDILETKKAYTIYRKCNPYKPNKQQLKSNCLIGAGGNSCGNYSKMDIVVFDNAQIPIINNRIDIFKNVNVRRYSTIECERLQTLPDNYTNFVSNSRRYKHLANGWTVDVIAHILKGMHNAA